MIHSREVQVHARNVPLTTIRKKLVQKHQQFMRLSGDREIELLSHEEAQALLQNMQCEGSGLSLAEMKETIRKYQRSRMICLWHDHGTDLGSGIILVAAHIIYDLAVFMTTHKYHLTPGLKVHSVQTEVEMPEVHLIALGTSSAEDQASHS